MSDESMVIGVIGNPPTVVTCCPDCDEWHETRLPAGQARILAVQLLVAADEIPVAALIPTVAEPVTED